MRSRLRISRNLRCREQPGPGLFVEPLQRLDNVTGVFGVVHRRLRTTVRPGSCGTIHAQRLTPSRAHLMKADFALFYVMRQTCNRKRLASFRSTSKTNRRDCKWPNPTTPQQSVSEKLPSKRKRLRSARRNWASPQPTKVCGKISRRQPAKVRLPPEPDYLADTVLRIIQHFARLGQDLPEAGIIPFEACLLGQDRDLVAIGDRRYVGSITS